MAMQLQMLLRTCKLNMNYRHRTIQNVTDAIARVLHNELILEKLFLEKQKE